MIAPNLISASIPTLQLSDSGERAMFLMHEVNLNQLPILDGEKYCGVITMDEIINLKKLDRPISELVVNIRQPKVMNTAHIFEVMKAAVEYNVRVVPVVDQNQNYMGLITAESCLRAFATLNSVNHTGATIELEIAQKDYQLSDIAKIVEENNADILCHYTKTNTEAGVVEVTLKLDTTELAPIVSAFERYNYEVKEVYNEIEYSEDMKERYDSFMRYLNV